MARGLKLRIVKVEGLYHLCSENKGADQLLGYREADLRLFIACMRKSGFLTTQLIFCWKHVRSFSLFSTKNNSAFDYKVGKY